MYFAPSYEASFKALVYIKAEGIRFVNSKDQTPSIVNRYSENNYYEFDSTAKKVSWKEFFITS